MKSKIITQKSSRPQFKKRENESFHAAVKGRVNKWFEDRKLSPFATPAMKIKTVIHLFAYIGLYGLIMSDQFSGPIFFLLWALFGMVQGMMGFNISHDALHGAYSANPRINRLFGYLFDWNGASSYVWKKTHNIQHHTYTNITGQDNDIDKAPLLRLSPHDPWSYLNQFQAFYAPLLYSLVSLPWIFYGDWKTLYEEAKTTTIPRHERVVFTTFKVVNFTLLLVLPLVALSAPLWQILLGIFIMHMCGGFILSIIFQLAHLVEGVEFPLPDHSGIMESEWAAHEMKTTANFATTSSFWTWMVGGLNFQIEHHLFPQICHIHYPAISSIVKATALEFGLPYHEKPSLSAAVKSHFRLLNKFGKQRRPACLIQKD